MKPLILASASLRRQEICTLMGLDFTVIPAAEELLPDPALSPEAAVIRIARGKAEAVALSHPGMPVLGADTVVESGGHLLGKPRDAADAAAMLRLLSGTTHRVITAVWLCDGKAGEGFADTTAVTFDALSDADIAAYIATGEPLDKAGAYAIQGRGMRYIRRISGDFYTVMGLPAARLYTLLRRHLDNE